MKRLLLSVATLLASWLGAQASGGHLFYEDFATTNNFAINWTVLDNNSDNSTWEYDDSSSPDADGGVGIARSIYNRSNAADDYLTTRQPIALKAGTNCLSFYYRTSGLRNQESFDVLYGTSKDVSKMKILKSYSEISYNEWQISINEFDIEDAGNYYFSFHVISDANKSSVWLDNIAVDEGGYKGTPDITLANLILPPSDCNLGINPIGVTVKNVGTGVIDGFSLYYEIDDQNKVIQNFPNKIPVGGTLAVTFDTPADFSAVNQAYIVKVVANCENQTITKNDTIKGRIVNLPPATLPFESKFENPLDALNWNPIAPEGWTWNSEDGCYKAEITSPLLSRCIHMTPGEYRIIFSYNAGDMRVIDSAKLYDYFYLALGKSGTDISTWNKIESFKEYTESKIMKKEVQFSITEEGDYDLCFTPTELVYLQIYNITVSKIAEHDVKVESITSEIKIPRTIPQYQINATHKFKVSVTNYGKQVENNVKIDIKGNDDIISTKTIATLAVGENKEETLDITLANIKSDKEQAYTFSAEASISQDDYPADNISKFTTMVSDSTYVWDNPADLSFGTGGSKSGVSVGTTFTLLKEDILTSITTAFISKPALAQNKITLNVYKVNDNSSVATPLVSVQVLRGEGGKEIIYGVPATTLAPGKYMFEVKQGTSNNMGLVCDQTKDGLIAAIKNDFVNELPGYGAPYIRPNFSKNAPTGIRGGASVESKLLLYPNPASELINIKTNGSQIKNIAIHNLLGQTVLTAVGNGSAEQNMNISTLSSGTYLVVITTNEKSETIKLIVK